MALSPLPVVSADQFVVPTQVWAHVPTELQGCTIRLLARLALNLVVTQAAQPEAAAAQEALDARPGFSI